MRITNKIIQNNSLSNINRNKVLEDKLNTQLGSGKKITRPSDDPVIAIRALRLRTSYSEIVQYKDKNAEDAESWLEITESSINELTDILSDMYQQCNQGTNEDLSSTNRKILLDSLKAYKESVYDSGNADYAGRHLFTGFRTGETLTFTDDTVQQYTITEDLQSSALDTLTYVSTWGLENYNSGNYAGKEAVAEASIMTTTVNRLRLSYDEMDTVAQSGIKPSITYYVEETTAGGTTAWVKKTVECTEISRDSQNPDPYTSLAESADEEAVFIPETGEIILSSALATRLSAVDTNPASQKITDAATGVEETVDASRFYVTYSKSEWKNGNPRPEHYYSCVSDDANAQNRDAKKDEITYNNEGVQSQIIEYDVGSNQRIRVNTLATEAYDINIGRDVDDMINALEKVVQIEDTISSLEGLLDKNTTATDISNDITERDQLITNAPTQITDLIDRINNSTTPAGSIAVSYGTADPKTATLTGVTGSSSEIAELTEMVNSYNSAVTRQAKEAEETKLKAAQDLEAARKAYDYLKENLTSVFSSGITKMKNHMDKASLALTAAGNRGAKLELVKTRLASQKTSVKDLVADNEEADAEDVATRLKSAELAYDASLAATAKIIQKSLLDYL